ncbi:MAG: phosphomethylpyrimidine synthase ThiC [Desulfovibrionales bacterium]|nr:phosphomethylpyrimidine synthase ThiC [Desulfovibrionales bacterium]
MSMTLRETAVQGKITPAMKRCAQDEGVAAAEICKGIASGCMAIPANKNRKLKRFVGIGQGLKTKINANIGTSKDHVDIEYELKKLKVALSVGADAVMDLSTGGPIDEIRRVILKHCPVPLGTVPIYQAAVETVEKRKKSIVDMRVKDILQTIERQAEEGVDFMTVHCGITRESAARLKKAGRILGVVSRGGAFTLEWMEYNQKENPLYEHFDELLAIARAYDVTLSLGDGLRPGCLSDATDLGQIQELVVLGELTRRAWDAGVQVIIEGPGHMPMDQIAANVLLQKKLCFGAPFYVLGPLVTDIAPGYDHITGAIGGAIAAAAGADFLCYVTPAEHLKLPSLEDVKEGVVASRIAAHAADIVKKVPGALEADESMARSRSALDWQGQISLSIDPEKAKAYREEGGAYHGPTCTMCGEYCAIKVYKRAIRKQSSKRKK